ncbi:MAG: hypothetical protein LH647_22965 [Leptolyngbyaceae cyanobacterium CAN_BIN12]|nr:hypothetical protein [Leptolyngbyaceae cyanobacterium CAN_BIN12]
MHIVIKPTLYDTAFLNQIGKTCWIFLRSPECEVQSQGLKLAPQNPNPELPTQNLPKLTKA